MKTNTENPDKELKKKSRLKKQMISGCFVYMLQDKHKKHLLHLLI